jgi:SAM-dependent methyltransferase
MDRYTEANQTLWDQLAAIHVGSDFYEVDAFKAGKSTLLGLELEEMAPLDGKELLHLQCHFGLDTLSCARAGATVTGVDFSAKAIELAQALAAEVNIPARFVCSDLYELPRHLEDQFDLVYTGGGVLTWLPDVKRWAQIVARYTRPGGTFYLREFHPFGGIFDDETEASHSPRIRYPYFHSPTPMEFEADGSYADRNATVSGVSYEWLHGIGDIISALIEAGMRIDWLHEFPYCSYQSLPCLEQGEDGYWRYPGAPESIPLMFSIKATKG